MKLQSSCNCCIYRMVRALCLAVMYTATADAQGPVFSSDPLNDLYLTNSHLHPFSGLPQAPAGTSVTVRVSAIANLGCNSADACSCNPCAEACCDVDPDNKFLTVSHLSGTFFGPWNFEDPTTPTFGRSPCSGNTIATNQDTRVIPASAWNTLIGTGGNVNFDIVPSSGATRLQNYCNSLGITGAIGSFSQMAITYPCIVSYCPTVSCKTATSCNGNECVYTNQQNGTSCIDDGNPCTDDVCAAGVCTHPFNSGPCGNAGDTACDNPDTCDGSGVCQNNWESNGTSCADTLFCNGAETCQNGACVAGGDPCTIGATECDEATDSCVQCVNGAQCSDNLACNGVETCVNGTCQAAVFEDCDGNGIADTCQLEACFSDLYRPFGNTCPHDFVVRNATHVSQPISAWTNAYGQYCQGGSYSVTLVGGSFTTGPLYSGGPCCGDPKVHFTIPASSWNQAVDNSPNGSVTFQLRTTRPCNDCFIAGQANSGVRLLVNWMDNCLDCNDNNVPDLCDISAGKSFDVNNDEIPDECQGAPAKPSGVHAVHDRQKNRYISFRPNSGSSSVAFRVVKEALADNAGFCTGNPGAACTGAPAQGTCPSGSLCMAPFPIPPGSPAHSCWVQVPQQDSNSSPAYDDQYTATCDASPVYRVWNEPVVHVGDCEIIPTSTYRIFANAPGEIENPIHLPVQTIEQPTFNSKLWGDSVGINDGVTWTAPNRFTNVQDVLALLAIINDVAIRPHFTVANLQATSAPDSCLNCMVNIADVLIANQAISGATYGAPSTGKITNTSACSICPPCGTTMEGFAGGGGEGFFGPESFSSTPTFDLTVTPYQIDAEETATVSVYLDAAEVIGGYEVSLDVTGGTTGTLSREAITINTNHNNFLFAGHGTYLATNVESNMAGAVEASGAGVLASSDEYLATYTFLASSDAEGVFEVRVSDERSFILDEDGNQVAHDASVVAYVRVGVECTSAAHCDDGNQCTSDVCTSGACVNTNLASGTPCDDGLYCTLTDTCDGSGVCVGSAAKPCSKPNPVCCEGTDSCHPSGYECELES